MTLLYKGLYKTDDHKSFLLHDSQQRFDIRNRISSYTMYHKIALPLHFTYLDVTCNTFYIAPSTLYSTCITFKSDLLSSHELNYLKPYKYHIL